MALTITEKILAAHSGKKKVFPGELIEAKVDICLGNDITAPLAISEFKKTGAKKVFNKNRVCLIPDHFTPNKDIKSAQQVKILRDFAREQNITHYYEGGRCGVEHALLPEKGIVAAGDVIIGADSHTCTYGALGAFATGVGSTDLAAVMATGKCWFKVPSQLKFVYKGKLKKWTTPKDLILYTIGQIGVDGALYKSMEFCGDVIKTMPMSGRMTICNMAIEAGGKNGIITPDKITRNYLKNRALRKYKFYKSDTYASYERVYEFDINKLEPVVSLPHLPSNVKEISKAAGLKIDQAVIGSCTNGRIEDLREAALVLKGRKVNKNVRCIIMPATPQIYKQAMKEGLLAVFMDADCVVSPPTCGPCLGGHMGVLAKGERAVATTNRNFTGRMGHPESEVVLSSPAVAAASAVKGELAHPAEIVK